VIVYHLGLHLHPMDSDYDPQREAEAAMKLAVAAAGAERQRLIWLAMAWRELASARPWIPDRRSDKAA
jgi:hypothetical protein